MSVIAKKIVFRGTVQGVGFRFTAMDVAGRYGIDGYVCNMPDGTVEMFAQGSQADIFNCAQDIMSEFKGYISDVKMTDEQVDSSIQGFRIRF